jgi:hypothetical protein
VSRNRLDEGAMSIEEIGISFRVRNFAARVGEA